jgi:hypothetical protein
MSGDLLSVQADAQDRSWRTFLQGLAIDLVTAAVIVLAMNIADLQWTAAYWAVIGTTVAKSLVQAFVAYWMRMFVAPRPPR